MVACVRGGAGEKKQKYLSEPLHFGLNCRGGGVWWRCGGGSQPVVYLLFGMGKQVRLLVSDEGVGIAEEDLSRVFDPFYTTRQGGTGLGLATVERVAREHGGSVWARSEPGGGTAFAIWLPLPGEFAPDAEAPEGSNG